MQGWHCQLLNKQRKKEMSLLTVPVWPEVLAERLLSISPRWLQRRALHACSSPAIFPPPWLSQKPRRGAPGLALQGDEGCQSHGGAENLWQIGQRVRTARC